MDDQKGVGLFDTLFVALGVNPDKRCAFSPKDRIEMISESTKHIPNLTIVSFSDLYLVDFAKRVGAHFLLRGLRAGSDFEYERVLRHINADRDSSVETVFMSPPRELGEVSSSLVKGLVGPFGWEALVGKYVSPCVLAKLKEEHHARPL